MQVSINSAVPASQLTPPTRAPTATAPLGDAQTFTLDKRIDFSHITPRQLLDYVTEQERLGVLSRDEGDALAHQIPVTLSDAGPYVQMDTPLNLRASLQGTMEFHLDTKSGLASWYAGLIDRLATLEAQSIRLSAEV
jgi:hypothetical protein